MQRKKQGHSTGERIAIAIMAVVGVGLLLLMAYMYGRALEELIRLSNSL